MGPSSSSRSWHSHLDIDLAALSRAPEFQSVVPGPPARPGTAAAVRAVRDCAALVDARPMNKLGVPEWAAMCGDIRPTADETAPGEFPRLVAAKAPSRGV